jgi:hypothetical protein
MSGWPERLDNLANTGRRASVRRPGPGFGTPTAPATPRRLTKSAFPIPTDIRGPPCVQPPLRGPRRTDKSLLPEASLSQKPPQPTKSSRFAAKPTRATAETQ